MDPGAPIQWLVRLLRVIGGRSVLVWSPLTVTAIRKWASQLVGEGSAVSSAILQLGAVLGNMRIAVLHDVVDQC